MYVLDFKSLALTLNLDNRLLFPKCIVGKDIDLPFLWLCCALKEENLWVKWKCSPRFHIHPASSKNAF